MALQELVLHIGSLANQVLQRDAHQAICKAKAASPKLFSHPAVFAQVHAILALYRFKLPVRRFLHDMIDSGAQHFEVPLDARIRSRSFATGIEKGAVVSSVL